MMMKKGVKSFLNLLNSKPVIGIFIFVMLSLAMVFAGNVVVKEGSITTENDFNGSNILFINKTAGKVGIGTTNIDGATNYFSKLSVQADDIYSAAIFGNGGFGVYGNGTTGIYGVGYTTGVLGNSVLGTGVRGTGVYAIYATGTTYDFYASSSGGKSYFAGRVGIGTTAPDYTLDVNGQIHATSYYSSDGYAGETLNIDCGALGVRALEVKNGLVMSATCNE